MPQLPEHFHPTHGDSAGQPWAGRRLESSRFADDDGTTPPAVAAAMAKFRAGDGDEVSVVEALRESRVLIPLVAELGEAGQNAEGVTVDKSADLSIVTVAGPDGRTVLPVFTSMDAMTAWNATARPVPTDFRAATLAAADERTDLIIVDPGGEGEFGLRRPAVWAVAKGVEWVPALTNPAVATALAEGIAREPHVRRIDVAPGCPPGRLEGAELRVSLVFEAGCSQDDIRAAVARVNERWSASPAVVELVDSLAVVIVAEAAGDAGADGRARAAGGAEGAGRAGAEDRAESAGRTESAGRNAVAGGADPIEASSSEGARERPNGMRRWLSRFRRR